MKRLSALILALVIMATAAGAAKQKARPKPKPTPKPHLVAMWSGENGVTKTTEAFQVKSKPWVVRWNLKNNGEFSAPLIVISVKNSHGDDVDYIQCAEAGIGSSTVILPPGTYHLKITTGVCAWTVAVVDMR